MSAILCGLADNVIKVDAVSSLKHCQTIYTTSRYTRHPRNGTALTQRSLSQIALTLHGKYYAFLFMVFLLRTSDNVLMYYRLRCANKMGSSARFSDTQFSSYSRDWFQSSWVNFLSRCLGVGSNLLITNYSMFIYGHLHRLDGSKVSVE